MEKKIMLNIKIITDYMKENKLTKTEMARKCGLTLCKFNRVLKGRGNIPCTYFIGICDLIKCRFDDFYLD